MNEVYSQTSTQHTIIEKISTILKDVVENFIWYKIWSGILLH